MTDIRYVFGDATDPQAHGHMVIVHVCNDIGAWGAGFVVAVSRRWPGPEAVYRAAVEAAGEANPGCFPPLTLGHVQFVPVTPDIHVANMVAQNSVRQHFDAAPPIRYDAVATCLAAVADWALSDETVGEFGPVSVHMPRIGCGLAGGDWAKIEPIILKELCAKGVPVTVYDLRS